MDLPLWDASDGQGYMTFSRSNYVGDAWHGGHYSGYGPDVIEEDALNEKSCMQVLRILMDKADEEIIKLEEDIAMLHSQLAWDDEDWSKPCSAALREKIEHLDILIQSLEKEVTADVHDFSIYLEQPDKLPQRLHDLVKPLVENYLLVKSKQTENSISQATDLAAAGHSKKKPVANASKSEKKVETTSTRAKVTQCERAHESNVTNSGLELQETETKIAETVKPADVILDSQIDCVKQMSEASRKIRKATVSTPAIDKNTYSTVPLVKAKGKKRTKFPRITEALEAQATEMKDNDPDSLLGLFNHRKIPVSKPRMKLETIRVQQIHEMKSLVISRTKSIPSLKPETQGSEKKCTAAPEVENLCPAAEIDEGSSSIGNLKVQQKLGVPKKISMNSQKETQQESSETKMDGASEVTITSISSPQKKRKLSLKTIRWKQGLRNFLMKLAEPDYDPTDSTAVEATNNHAVEDLSQNPSACIEDVENLSLYGLKTNAKNH